MTGPASPQRTLWPTPARLGRNPICTSQFPTPPGGNEPHGTAPRHGPTAPPHCAAPQRRPTAPPHSAARPDRGLADRYLSHGPDGATWGDGPVLEFDPPRRLVHEWRSLYDADMAQEQPSRVTWEIEPGRGRLLPADADPRPARRSAEDRDQRFRPAAGCSCSAALRHCWRPVHRSPHVRARQSGRYTPVQSGNAVPNGRELGNSGPAAGGGQEANPRWCCNPKKLAVPVRWTSPAADGRPASRRSPAWSGPRSARDRVRYRQRLMRGPRTAATPGGGRPARRGSRGTSCGRIRGRRGSGPASGGR